MGAPAEVLQEIFTVIEGGKTIGEAAEIIQFPTDNGLRTIGAVNKTFQGSNGTGLNYWVAAVASGASAVSMGAIFLTTELTAFAASVGPALGVLVGYSWYQLAPEFWDEVAKDLMEASETVNGKVIGFLNEKGIVTYTPNAIDIFKSKCIEYGVFDTTTLPEYQDTGDYEVTKYIKPNEMVNLVLSRYKYPFYFTPEANAKLQSILLEYPDQMSMIHDMNVNILASSTTQQIWTYLIEFCDPEERIDLGEYIENLHGIIINMVKHPTWPDSNLVVDVTFVNAIGGKEYFVGEISTTPGFENISGIEADYNKKGLQDNAKYPDSESVRIKYPYWIPWEFPDLPGWQIPEALPLQYPKLIPTEVQPYQEPAQNPEGDDETADEGVKKIEAPENNPEVPVIPTPPDIDPDPGDEGEDIDDPTDEDSNPDPIDPDPPTPITPVIPPPALPDSVHSNKLFTVYNPSSSQLGQLGGYLWDDDLIDILRKIWQNPLDGIISLIQVYATPVTGGSSNIILGYLDSGVSAPVVSNQFVTIDCGSVNIPEQNENCLDYIPYTKLELYLPFIGVTEIDTNEFMAGSINVKYKVDVYTGTCLAEVKCTRSRDLANGTILYIFNGNCSQQIPLTSGDARGVLGALIGAAGLGLSIASGGAAAVTGAGLLRSGARVAGGLASMTSQEMLHVGHSGNLSANAGIMGQKKPYLIINRKRAYTANSYNRYYGFPANKTVNPGNHSGFLRLKAGRLQSAATEEEKAEIYELLTHGVIM